MAITLRPYQEKMLEDVRQHLRAGARRVLMVAPTGAGKGSLACRIVTGANKIGKRVLFLVNRRELVKDMSRRLDALQLDHGIIMADHPRRKPWLSVHIASIDTLRNRRQKPAADILIADEAHFAVSQSWVRTFEAYPDAAVIGMTATPARLDGRGLGRVFQQMVMGPTVEELTADGFLVPTKVYGPPAGLPDLSGVGKSHGEYNQKQLSVATNKPRLVGDIVQHWSQMARGRPTVLFAVDIAHSLKIRDAFLSAGVRAEHADANTPSDERDALWDKLADGRVEVVCSVGIVSFGWDCLDSETEILTGAGWKGMGQVQVGESIYSMNTGTGLMELVPCLDVGSRPRREGERMIHFNSQRINIRVTEGHRIISKRVNRRYQFSDHWTPISALDFATYRSNTRVPLAAPMECYPGIPLSDDEIRFIAWFMTDGSCSSKGFTVAQVKIYWKEIEALLIRLGFDYTKRERSRKVGYCRKKIYTGLDGPVHEFRVPKGFRGTKGFKKLLPYMDKDVSPLLHLMTIHQFRVFWEEALKGDGDVQKSKATGRAKSGWLWCDRKEQADAYQHMAVVRGFATSYNTRTLKSGKVMYIVTVRLDQRNTLDTCPFTPGSESRRVRDTVESEYRDELVWCATNRNGTLVTRRNGKVIILGNCPPVSCAILARPTASVTLYLQQAGRVLRPALGKDYALILDHAGNTMEHGAIDEPRSWTLRDGYKPKKSDGAGDGPGTYTCKKCLRIFGIALEKCPDCGTPRTKTAREIEVVDGQLTEIATSKYYKCPHCQKRGKLETGQDYTTPCPQCGVRALVELTAPEPVLTPDQIAERRAEYFRLVDMARKDGFGLKRANVQYLSTYKSYPPEKWRKEAAAQEAFAGLGEEVA